MTIEDREIIIVLPLKTWRTVVAHLRAGVHRDVDPILRLMGVQAEPQINLAQKDAADRAAAETARLELALIRAMEKTTAAPAAATPPTQPNNGVEEAAEPPARPSSLH